MITRKMVLTQPAERRSVQHLLPQQILPEVSLIHHHFVITTKITE